MCVSVFFSSSNTYLPTWLTRLNGSAAKQSAKKIIHKKNTLTGAVSSLALCDPPQYRCMYTTTTYTCKPNFSHTAHITIRILFNQYTWYVNILIHSVNAIRIWCLHILDNIYVYFVLSFCFVVNNCISDWQISCE